MLDTRQPVLTAELLSSGNPGIPAPPHHFQSFPSLAEALAALRATWTFQSFSLEVSLPAAMAVRAQAVYWRLQDAAPAVLPMAAWVDVKEALRRQYAAQLAELSGAVCDQKSAMKLSISCSLDTETAHEAAWLVPAQTSTKKRSRRGRNKAAIPGHHEAVADPVLSAVASPAMVSKLAAMPREEFFTNCPACAAQLVAPAAAAAVTLSPHRQALYIGGRYIKLKRGVPQSPWIMHGQRNGESSVQEEIAKVVVPLLGADSYTFLGAGREDMDVRMLGAGRPFALEVTNARRVDCSPQEFERMEASIAGSGTGVEVRGLRILGAGAVAALKSEEVEKRKRYAAVCWIPREVTDADLALLNAATTSTTATAACQDDLDTHGDGDGERRGDEAASDGQIAGELIIRQKTPIRVLHRRANLERLRAVHELRAERLPAGAPQGYFLLRLTTQAGTYIKEFVHGDRGRTRPSVKELLGVEEAECVYLDVTGVDAEFM